MIKIDLNGAIIESSTGGEENEVSSRYQEIGNWNKNVEKGM
jgi:hypothetical protein